MRFLVRLKFQISRRLARNLEFGPMIVRWKRAEVFCIRGLLSNCG